jgi:WD40 repeat protein
MAPSALAILAVLSSTLAQEPVTLKGHAGPVLCVSFAPDGKTLASGSHDQNVKLWDVAEMLKK